MCHLGDTLLEAALATFKARHDVANANLATYLHNSTAVGEHAGLAEEVIQLIEKLEHHESCFDLTKKLIKERNE